MSIEIALNDHLAKLGAMPFLFIGSGLSRRYLGIETWDSLLRRYSEGLANPYEYYRAASAGSYPDVATLMAEEFYDKWWSDKLYADSVNDFKENVVSRDSPLKYEISAYISKAKYEQGVDASLDAEIELLKKATVDGIITTNWDLLLESLFPDYKVFVGQEQVLFSRTHGIGEIFKIHGCATSPNSLVLTSADYATFNARNPYLAAKLLTIFVEHPVIFLGYSLTDNNVLDILKSLAGCLTNENVKQLRDRLIFVQRDSDQLGESFENSVIQVDGRAFPATIIRTNDFSKVYRPLTQLHRRFSARLLRSMKDHIYQLVKDNDPKQKLAVIDINDAQDFSKVEVVYGIGVLPKLGSTGYRAILRTDLIKDVIAETIEFDAKRVVQDVLPHILKGGVKYVPIFRYLREAGVWDGQWLVPIEDIPKKLRIASEAKHQTFYPPRQYQAERSRVQNELGSVAKVVECYQGNSFYYLPMLKPDQVNVDELRKHISAHLNLMSQDNTMSSTYFCKLICFYDWLKYR